MGRAAQQSALRGERGVALALVVFALVVVGALVATAFVVGAEEQRAGENSRRLEQALGIAEAGAYEVIRSWDPQGRDSLGVYPLDSARIGPVRAPAGTGFYSGYLFRLSRSLYLADVTGGDAPSRLGRITWRGAGGARQRVGILARVQPVRMDSAAARRCLARAGQGIILVDSNLAMLGDHRFYGVALVTRSASLGAGARRGPMTISHSKCMIDSVLRLSTPAVVLRSRGWAHLF